MTTQALSWEDPGPGHPAGLVLFVLGAAQVPPNPPLPAPALLSLLAELGLSEGAARSAILRMRRDGWLLSQRQGRGVSYAPSERTLAGHRRRATTFTPEGPPWGGAFHALLVSVPETERAFRDEFRRAAHIAGYRILRAGLLVAPSDRRDEIGDLLERVPLDASVLPAWLELAPEDARREASQLWKLDDLEKRYRRLAEHARTAAAVVTSSPTTSEDGILRPFAEVTLPIYRAIADDPGLPADLLPRDWPARELGSALGEALRAFGPAVASHIERRRRNSPG